MNVQPIEEVADYYKIVINAHTGVYEPDICSGKNDKGKFKSYTLRRIITSEAKKIDF